MIVNLLGAYVDFVGRELRLPTALAILLLVLIIRPQGLFGHARGEARVSAPRLLTIAQGRGRSRRGASS